MEKRFGNTEFGNNSVEDTDEKRLSRRTFFKGLGATLLGAAVTSPEQLFAQTQRAELSPRAEQKKIVEFIKQHRESVNYEKIWAQDKPVVFVGERHTLKSDKDEIINNLPELKKMGLTHVAMEMLLEEHQPVIDDYFSGKTDQRQLLKIFADGWNKRPGIAEKYMEFVDVLKAHNIQLLGIDLYTATAEYGTGEFFKKRNENWARLIAGVIKKDVRAKVLVYNGQSHSGYNMVDDSANEILNNAYNLPSTTVEFAGGQITSDNNFFVDKIGKAAQNLKIDKTKFGLPIDAQAEVREADYIIHLPQVEKD